MFVKNHRQSSVLLKLSYLHYCFCSWSATRHIVDSSSIKCQRSPNSSLHSQKLQSGKWTNWASRVPRSNHHLTIMVQNYFIRCLQILSPKSPALQVFISKKIPSRPVPFLFRLSAPSPRHILVTDENVQLISSWPFWTIYVSWTILNNLRVQNDFERSTCPERFLTIYVFKTILNDLRLLSLRGLNEGLYAVLSSISRSCVLEIRCWHLGRVVDAISILWCSR